jgi:hypothetical protein
MKKSLLVALLLLVSTSANAEEKTPTVTRKMIRADELPFGEVKKLAPAQVSLPGAKHGGAAPASWNTVAWDSQLPGSRCVDGRTASIESWHPDFRTHKIVTIDGKEFLDVATISIADDKINVKEATRTPIMKIVEATANVAVWGYRRQGEHGPEVVFVSAIDEGIFDRAINYGCSLQEHTAVLPTKSISFSSSATQAYEVAQRIFDNGMEDGKKRPGKRPTWVGENYRVEVSTSKSSADPTPMVAIFIRR